MRSSVFIALPFLAFVSAATTSSGSYSNPLTTLLTETNSNGVVTGMPGNGPTAVVTSQPAKATIPAGLPTGETTIYYSASSTLQSFAISVGPSTTVAEAVGASASSSSSAAAGNPTGKGKGSGNGGSGSSSSSSANAAPTNVKAGVGMLAVGAAAALLL